VGDTALRETTTRDGAVLTTSRYPSHRKLLPLSGAPAGASSDAFSDQYWEEFLMLFIRIS